MLVGIFIGGRSTRMGRTKGLLPAPSGESLVLRLVRVAEEAFPGGSIVLVGKHSDYDALSFEQLGDRIPDAGPLAGLASLLEFGRDRGHSSVLALSCDLPFVSAEFLRRLALEAPEAKSVVPRPERFYEPLVARYATSLFDEVSSRLERRELSLQRFVESAEPYVLPLFEDELGQLVDWDTPEDVARQQ